MKIWPFFRTIFVLIDIFTTVVIMAIVLFVFYAVKAKPFGITWSPGLITNQIMGGKTLSGSQTNIDQYDHPALTPAQENLAETLGIDTRTIPTEITPSQEDCATAALGEERVKAIADGATPSIIEILNAKHCLE